MATVLLFQGNSGYYLAKVQDSEKQLSRNLLRLNSWNLKPSLLQEL